MDYVASQGRADQLGHAEDGGIQHHATGDFPRTHHVGHECAAGRVHQGECSTVEKREGEQVPSFQQVGHKKEPLGEKNDKVGHFPQDQDRAAVQPVGYSSTKCREEEHGYHGNSADGSDQEGRIGTLQHQPATGNKYHEEGDQGNERCEPQEAKISISQGAQGARQG